MNLKKYFYDHFLFCILVLLIIVVSTVSYYRFMIKHDYIVSYQGPCDPSTGKCFKSCEDDACTKVDFYLEMQKYEPDLYKECGKDITDCGAASACFSSDHNCFVTYCNPDASSDTCESTDDKVGTQDNSQNKIDSTTIEQKSLSNNTTNS